MNFFLCYFHFLLFIAVSSNNIIVSLITNGGFTRFIKDEQRIIIQNM